MSFQIVRIVKDLFCRSLSQKCWMCAFLFQFQISDDCPFKWTLYWEFNPFSFEFKSESLIVSYFRIDICIYRCANLYLLFCVNYSQECVDCAYDYTLLLLGCFNLFFPIVAGFYKSLVNLWMMIFFCKILYFAVYNLALVYVWKIALNLVKSLILFRSNILHFFHK